MAIIPETQYPGKTTAASSSYPYGGAQNVTAPGDGTGTPWEAALLNDIFGFQQSLLSEAGETPSGSPETALASQYKEAMRAITNMQVVTHNMASDANYTLTVDQNKKRYIQITDTGVVLTAARDIIVDVLQKRFIAKNSTAQALIFKTPAGTGITVEAGGTVDLYNDGTNVINATTILVASTAEAQAWTDNAKAITPLRLAEALQGTNQSTAANGYQKLPGGLILQWGTAGSIALNSNVAVVFPVTFPTAALHFSGSLEYVASGNDIFDGHTSLTASGVNFENGGGVTSVDSKWFAIGY